MIMVLSLNQTQAVSRIFQLYNRIEVTLRRIMDICRITKVSGISQLSNFDEPRSLNINHE